MPHTTGSELNIEQEPSSELDQPRLLRSLIIATVGVGVVGTLSAFMLGMGQIEPVGAWIAGLANTVVLLWISSGLFMQGSALSNQNKAIADQIRLNARTLQSLELQIALQLYRETNVSLARILREILYVHKIYQGPEVENAISLLNQGYCDPIADLFLQDSEVKDRLINLIQTHPMLVVEIREYIALYNGFQSELSKLSISVNTRNVLMDTSLYKQINVLFQDVSAFEFDVESL